MFARIPKTVLTNILGSVKFTTVKMDENFRKENFQIFFKKIRWKLWGTGVMWGKYLRITKIELLRTTVKSAARILSLKKKKKKVGL